MQAGFFTKLRVRTALRRQGYSRRQVESMMEGLTEPVYASAVAQVEAKHGAGCCSAIVDADGDRPILDAIIAFFNSEAGKALIQALVALLISLIG